ncbi:hypothetical protein CsSME_00049128 [Camellia sinensis var. sinensis]
MFRDEAKEVRSRVVLDGDGGVCVSGNVSVQQSRCSSPAEEVVSEVECPTMVVLDGWSSTVMEPECPAILVVECPTMAQGARVRRGAQECLSV